MPTAYTQDQRRIGIETPLGPDALLLVGFNGREELSRLFAYELDLRSENAAIDPKEIVGKAVSFFTLMPDETPRHFHGFVRKFAYLGTGDRLSIYRAEVVPWLWFLTRTTDCRVYQNKSVPDIVKAVFTDLGFTDFEVQARGAHVPWEFCVQYRESDFNFISRLLEQEGLFYYFKHEQGKHTLVIADHKGAYADALERSVEFSAHNESQVELTDQVMTWAHNYEFRSGKVAHTDYNHETPSGRLLANTETVMPFADAKKFELYDYPGEYEVKGDGDGDIKLRMEEEEARHDVVTGTSKCRSFSPGCKFKLTRHPSDAEKNRQYVLTAVEHRCRLSGALQSGEEADALDYINSFECIPAATVFRPARLTPKPRIHGVQTAVVVGPPGEKIYPDSQARVKVQFHWDRLGKKDDKSSCWVRVSQNWGGNNWGGLFIPHVGQEVIVAFLEGDPDRPLITGRVYNAEQAPPLALPAKKTKSGLRDHGGNELLLEGDDGVQQVHIHSPTAGSTINVGAPGIAGPGIAAKTDAFLDFHVGADWKNQVNGTMHLNIDVNQVKKVGANAFWHVVGTWDRKVNGQFKTVIGAMKTEIILGSENKLVGPNKLEVITGIGTKLHYGHEFKRTPTSTELSAAEKKSKAGKEEKLVGSAVEKAGKMLQNVVGELNAQSGYLNQKIKAAYDLAAGKLNVTSKGPATIKAPHIILDASETDVDGHLTVMGSVFTIK